LIVLPGRTNLAGSHACSTKQGSPL